MKYLMILNDAPYGTERSYNGLRLARSLLKTGEAEVRMFLIGDASSCAKNGQKVPQGYYNIERMLKLSLNKGAKVKICGSCADARGLKNSQLVEGAEMSTMAELTNWVVDSDKVLTF